MAREVSTY